MHQTSKKTGLSSCLYSDGIGGIGNPHKFGKSNPMVRIKEQSRKKIQGLESSKIPYKLNKSKQSQGCTNKEGS